MEQTERVEKVMRVLVPPSEHDWALLSDTLGSQSIKFLQDPKNELETLRQLLPMNTPFRENFFAIKAGDRAIILILDVDPPGNPRRKIEVNFQYWDNYSKGDDDYGRQDANLGKNTLGFFQKLSSFLETIENSCEVEFTGSDEQRRRLWEKGTKVLQARGKSNIHSKPPIKIDL